MPKLANVESCTGCFACSNSCSKQAIHMSPDGEGFYMPVVDLNSCVECGVCEKVCPIVTPFKQRNTSTPGAYALWQYEDRQKSSSGGAFSAIARLVLSAGGVIYGSVFSGLDVFHVKAESIEEMAPMRGSKYVQSNVGSIYKDVKNDLLTGRKVLFTGTPCQVAGLKSFLRKDFDNLILVDIACHGVPSLSVFQSYVNKVEKRLKINKIATFGFRKINGWGFVTSIEKNGRYQSLYGIDNLYMKAFDKAAIFRKSCYQCPFASIHRVGDCTIGDFWGIGHFGDKFRYDTLKGVSLVLVNNNRGHAVINSLQNCFIEERNLRESFHMNHNLIAPSTLHPKRDEVIAAFLDENMTLENINKEFHLVNKNIKSKVSEWSERFGVYSIIKRIYNFCK